MSIAASGKNLMLDALKGTNPTTPITHVGLFTKNADRAVTGTASTNLINDTATPYANGDIVVFSAINGGAGLVIGRIYFVVNKVTNGFELAVVPGGATVDFTSDAVATTTIARFQEISGGSPAYARKAIAFNAAVGGSMDDSTNGAVFDVAASTTVNAVGYHSAVSAGTLLALDDDVTPETFGAQGTYTLTDADVDLNQGF